MSETRFEIYCPIAGKGEGLGKPTWTDIDPVFHCDLGQGELCIYLKGHKGEEEIAVEVGFSESQGPYVSMWGKGPHISESHAGRFYLSEILMLKKLSGE